MEQLIAAYQAQLAELENQKSALNPNTPDDKWQITVIEGKQAEVQAQIDALNLQVANQAAAVAQIQQAHEDRVTQVTSDFNVKLESLEVSNGMTLRDVMEEIFYQASTIAIKGLYQAEVDELSKQIAANQTELSETNAKYAAIVAELQSVQNQLNQERLEHTYTAQSRDNAARLLEEANETIAQLQEQLKAATAGIKVTNTEEEKRLKEEADLKIKRERTVYNRTWAVENATYQAYRAIDGQYITFPYYAEKAYIVINESEVSQFRSQYGVETTTPTENNTSTDGTTETPTGDVTTEDSFPTLPTVETPEVPSGIPVDQGVPSEAGESGQTITAEQLETRLAQFAQEYGLVKGQVA